MILNANAGKHNDESRQLARSVEPAMHSVLEENIAVHLFPTKSLADLDTAVENAVRLEPDAIFSVGGDGTTHHFLSRLIPECERRRKEIPKLGIVPAGTMNVIPSALGLVSENPHESFERVVRKFLTGEPHKTVQANALRVNDRYGFLYGAGLPARSLMRYNAYEKRGVLRAAQVFGQIMAEEIGAAAGATRNARSVAEPFMAAMSCVDDQGPFISSDSGWTSVMAGTIESIGLGSKPLYRAREKPGSFHLIGCEHGFWNYASRLHAIVLGKTLGGKMDRPVTKARIHYDRPMTRFIDGDIYEPDSLDKTTDTLECGPLLTFLKP